MGTKKKLTIFQIINKSRNIFQFNKLKEVVMKDKIRSIDKFDEDSIIIGLVNNYVICEFADFGVSSLAIEKTIICLVKEPLSVTLVCRHPLR